MNAPDHLSRLRQKNAEKNTPSPNCINPVKDFTQFVQFAPSAKKVDFSKNAPPALDADLHRRILKMAERWGYSGDELAIVLHDAALNPAGWLLTVTCDESNDWNQQGGAA